MATLVHSRRANFHQGRCWSAPPSDEGLGEKLLVKLRHQVVVEGLGDFRPAELSGRWLRSLEIVDEHAAVDLRRLAFGARSKEHVRFFRPPLDQHGQPRPHLGAELPA